MNNSKENDSILRLCHSLEENNTCPYRNFSVIRKLKSSKNEKDIQIEHESSWINVFRRCFIKKSKIFCDNRKKNKGGVKNLDGYIECIEDCSDCLSLRNSSLKSFNCQSKLISSKLNSNYIKCLCPDLSSVVKLPYYWGSITCTEANEVLSEAPDGSYILRDSSHHNYAFSVSYRRFSTTMHARIEITVINGYIMYTFNQNDKESLKAHSVRELLRGLSYASNCMCYEPVCSKPISNTIPASLQELCRAKICNVLTSRLGGLNQKPSLMTRFKGNRNSDALQKHEFKIQLQAYSLIDVLPLPHHIKDFLKHPILFLNAEILNECFK